MRNELDRRGIQYQIVTRQNYTVDEIKSADMIMSAGGDGTFLMAAAKVVGLSKPVLGINTDPRRSEGILCLPKEYSLNIGLVLDRILTGQFTWTWRQRIRIKMIGQCSAPDCVDLHDQELMYPEFRIWEHVRENEMFYAKTDCSENSLSKKMHQLPILALNEVFVGESLAARMSFYEMSVDGSKPKKQKSSGVTVCTGTGSSSWYFNINHLPPDSVSQIIKLLQKHGVPAEKTDSLVSEVTQEFNQSLTFDQQDAKMAFVVRDGVPRGIFQVEKMRGYCTKMSLRSRMWDAWVVVDGGLSFSFNDGATIELEVLPDDALRCFSLS